MQKTVLFFIILIFCSCSTPKETDDNQYKIVTTTGMLADVAQSIIGDHGTVQALMGPGVDPHLYKATQGDLKLLKEADVIIYNGLHLEGKMGEVLERLSKMPNKLVVAAGEAINPNELIIVDSVNQVYDPHIWFDVALWQQTVEPIFLALASDKEEFRTFFQQNASIKTEELDSLNQWVQSQIQQIPEEQRVLITAHDAFSYFGRAYNMKVIGLQGISTISEAGIKDVKDLVDYIVDHKIKAVFVESSVPKKSIEAVVEGAKQRGQEVTIGGTLYSDALGDPKGPAGNYKGMVQSNVKTIVTALK